MSLRDRVKDWQPHPNSKTGQVFRSAGVSDSVELRRIARLPRRTPEADPELSALLAKRDGKLRAIQAIGLFEAALIGGLVALVKVGGGKTLLTFLLSYVLDSERPVLAVPAKLRDKTIREFEALKAEWHHGVIPTVVSYELLGRESAATLLRELNPDLMILDEAHKAKNKDAAVTRRLARLAKESPTTKWVVLSGTLTKRSIRDMAHLFDWALAERSPLPRKFVTVQEWALAIDEKLAAGTRRAAPGALTQFYDETDIENTDDVQAARNAVRRRIVETPGVIATTDARIESSLVIELVPYDVTSPAITKALESVRLDWLRPDGESIMDAATKWRHAIEVSLGFYYRWEPEAPIEWRAARKAWGQCVRHILDHNRSELDSELQVARAVARGDYDKVRLTANGFPIGNGTVRQTYDAWRAIRDTFEPNSVPVWLDTGVIDFAEAWGGKGEPGIIWCTHVAVAEQIALCGGFPYYGAQGRDAKTGEPIEKANPRRSSIVASIASNGEGRNLQAWNRNLVIASSLDGGSVEQLLGRTHREGQDADEVTYEWLIACTEQLKGFEKAQADAEYIQRTTGSEQKLTYCDIVTITKKLEGVRWV